MNVLIIGAGRMGLRHATGIATSSQVNQIYLADISSEALTNAKNQLVNHPSATKFQYGLLNNIKENFEVAIIASTASDRISICQKVINHGVRYLLIEKPLGQSYQEVLQLTDFFSKQKVHAFVNLNMRMYPCFIQLKKDLNTLPQLQGTPAITINTGTLGIGANGIHYLDLLYFLFDADECRIAAADIESTIIPSGRGPQFADFGGWSTLLFYQKNKYKGRAQLSFSSQSTVFGGWDIVSSHGRITLNEVEQKRIDYLRKLDSQLPIQRYAGDYLPPVEQKIESPALGDLSREWLENTLSGNFVLPSLEQSLKVHKLLFDWLSHSKTHQEIFPIT